MPERDSLLFIKDIQTSSSRIIKYTKELSRKEFFTDHKTYDAVMRNLQIIGDAAKHLPPDFRRKHKNVEWKKVSGLRDIVVHEYFGINRSIIRDVIREQDPGAK